MKFDVLNRFSGDVQFTAEIDCDENASRSLKLGLAVKWGLKNKADLRGANLSGSDLRGANLSGSDLSGAYLSDAYLSGANLSDAYLSGANLSGANLWDANLSYAYLSGANLSDAYLSGANLSDAYLSGANLSYAYLSGANLSYAYLSGANGLNDHIKCIQIETYPICYTSEVIQIGCERHSIEDWRSFDDERIVQMDGKTALKFWRKYKDWIFQTIELAPAKPTQEASDEG